MTIKPQPPLFSRSTRRRLVLGVFLGYLGVVLSWTLSSHWGGWLFAPTLLASGLTLYCYLTLMVRGQFWWQPIAPDLDERQAQARDTAYRLAYTYASSIILLVLLYWFIASDAERLRLWLPTTTSELNAVFWGMWLLLTTLPAAVLAWLEPEPIGE